MSILGTSQYQLDRSLRSLKQDQMSALDNIYCLMYNSVFKYVFSLIRDYHVAEDITQEVFLRVLKYRNRYRDGSNAKAWIYTIAKNLVFTKMKQQKEFALEDDKLTYLIDSNCLLEQSDLSFVKEAFDILKYQEQQIVSLHLYGGLKHYETAKVLGIPYSQVRSTYTYALKKIAKKLGDKI